METEIMALGQKRGNRGGADIALQGNVALEEFHGAQVGIDHEYSCVVAVGIARKHKEARLLRMVGLGGPDHLFTVTKDNFHLPAPSQLFGELNVIAGTVTREILNKKDRFHVLEPNVVRFSFLGGLRGENAEGLSEC